MWHDIVVAALGGCRKEYPHVVCQKVMQVYVEWMVPILSRP